MKVRELIALLQQTNLELEVRIINSDANDLQFGWCYEIDECGLSNVGDVKDEFAGSAIVEFYPDAYEPNKELFKNPRPMVLISYNPED